MSESKWKPIQWGNCCAEAEVLTTLTEPNVAYDGDEARCLGCGRPGVVSADDDEAHINWHDETDCKCWWCQQADEIDKSHATIADLRRQVESANRALAAINDIRNSIVGTQTVNWSAHVYPLVKVLQEAGFEGEGYEVAKAQASTLIEQRDALTKQLAEARAVIRKIRRSDLPDCEQPLWDELQAALGAQP